MAEITYREAVSTALREALDEDSRVFLVGEDIGPYGGPYAVTKGFLKDYGPERIKDSPLSESAFVGLGVGAAMAGLRPVVEVMTINFMLLPMDQIVNHAAKIRYMSGGQISVPLIVRTVTGGGAQLAATHSQSLEGWFASVPGLKVAVPATPYDALGLFRACLKEPDPVIFVEHILLYGARGTVPQERFEVPLGVADVKRPGRDITLVTYSRSVQVCLSAAEELASRGIEAEVVDLRCLRPLDVQTVVESVRKTHRAIVVEEANRTGAFGGEVVAQAQELAFDYLDAPVGRVAGEDVPIPYSRHLEALAIPDAAKVVSAVLTLMGRKST
ncbi:MAG: alpha-ketoacid dehydrogenase subunit beta [Chloroflexota bacterium]|nr:alpha-ketoacid dehydrogenase subunit beta [Chloroflexota bacterium]